ncbi:minor tail protein [Arthrobacter phage Abba]|uniref:Minor tail protein n=1 Tax=Arthrobacter phage Abba TaxID=2713256 RepID=A0A6G8R2C3_9CAUD|nr:endolysin [Arthrobacter phage Abba]QIN94349.1 minor tail protein [Arthrobacter phage Abba]
MPTTIETDSRLKAITVTGKGLSAELRDACSAASLSLGVDKVTQMSLSFADTHDLSIFRSGVLSSGSSVRYGDWYLVSDGLSVDPGDTGPVLSVDAPSKFVTALRKQTGAYSWGNVDVAAWVAAVARSVGMSSTVQPGLGSRTILRTKPESGSEAESTWDVLTALARELGTWLFEYGSRLVFAKPSWLVGSSWAHKTWALKWEEWGTYSAGMTGMPSYKDDPGAELRESLTFELVSPDADTARPGDMVTLGGRGVGGMGGVWIVKGVDFPLDNAGAVKLDCQRPVDPKIEPKRAATAASGTSTLGGGKASSGVSAAVDRFVGKYNGVAVDADGGFGAQCVDLARQYAKELFGVSISGNGNQWFANGAASGKFTQISASSKPQKGDLACWGTFYGGGYGHVALVLADGGGSLSVFTQNPGPCHKDTLSKQGLQGYLRPKAVS